MERWLSWSKAHDWKSCVPYKGTEGSNPSLSAKNKQSLKRDCLFFCVNRKDSNEPTLKSILSGKTVRWTVFR